MTDSDQNDEETLEEGTFLSHLLELRNRLLYSIIAVLVSILLPALSGKC